VDVAIAAVGALLAAGLLAAVRMPETPEYGTH